MRGPDKVRARPDMVEPPSPVGPVPVLGTVRPPGIEFSFGNVAPHDIGPVSGLGHRIEQFHFHLGVADHIQQLPVRPDIVLQRRNIEIPDKNRSFRKTVRGPFPSWP